MIQLHSLAYGAFGDVEPLNPEFASDHPKLRITVDADATPKGSDRRLHERLVGAFPGLGRHRCRVRTDHPSERRKPGIALVEGEVTANQAHLLEHMMLEMLHTLNGARRLSGVTCAYVAPPERSDVFVECADPELGGVAVWLGIETLNAGLAGEDLAPLYPDVLRCTAVLRQAGRGADLGASPGSGGRASREAGSGAAWSAVSLGEAAKVPVPRAAAALEVLRRLSLVEEEAYAMNLSGDAYYRMATLELSPDHGS